MGISEQLQCAIIEAGVYAESDKIPGPFAHTIMDVTHKSLELWLRDIDAVARFAGMMLSGSTNLRTIIGEIRYTQRTCAQACWGRKEYVSYGR